MLREMPDETAEDGCDAEGIFETRASVGDPQFDRRIPKRMARSPLAEVHQEPVEAAKREIAAEDGAHPLRLLFHHNDPAVLGLISERGHAADPIQPIRTIIAA